MVFEFFRAALPWVAMGLFVAISCARLGGSKRDMS